MRYPNYSYVAAIYSHLMRSIDYNYWADYIFSISQELKRKKLNVLELACGNGIIANNLKGKFKNYFASDLSKNMIKGHETKDIKFICCDMTSLPFSNKFDFVFSTFDSINYLLHKKKIIQLLNEVSRCLQKDGIFTFDVSLENNSKKYQKYLNRKGKVDGFKFIQKSKYDEANRIHYNYFEITLANGQKVEEIHKQKIYPFEEYFRIIDDSNFFVYKCYKAFTKIDASAESERVQFILKKKNNAHN